MSEGAPAPAGGVPPAAEPADAADEDLMTAYADGDASAFDVLYGRHRGAAYRYFRRQLSEAEANDCFQTLWMNLIRHRDRYAPDAPFRHYLFTLAHNVLMDHHRREMRRPVHAPLDADELQDGAPAPEERHQRERLRAHLHRLIQALPPHQREVWLLRQETDFSNRDIATVTGASEEGVKSRLRYARGKLKEGMARYAG